MPERGIQTLRDKAQIEFEQAGQKGFVEDFIETGADDLKFMAMNPKDQKLWIKLVETHSGLLDNLLYLNE